MNTVNNLKKKTEGGTVRIFLFKGMKDSRGPQENFAHSKYLIAS